jgi:hypothetical protein
MLRPSEDRFVLEDERNREQQLKPAVESRQQKLAGSAPVTAQGRNHHVRVDNERSRHHMMILRAISLVNWRKITFLSYSRRLPETRLTPN